MEFGYCKEFEIGDVTNSPINNVKRNESSNEKSKKYDSCNDNSKSTGNGLSA